MSQVHNQSFFCIPSAGKPNPNEPSTGAPRSRVKQNHQKGDTCLYYALQILRGKHKIGKNPSQAQQTARKEEKAFSDHRKRFTTLLSPKVDVIHCAEDLKELLGGATLSGGFRITMQNIDWELKELRVLKKHKPFLEAFCNQNDTDDMVDFAKKNYDRIAIRSKLCSFR